jgi:hypothetical protein
VERAEGRVAIHVRKRGDGRDPRKVGHHLTAPPRVP